MTQIEEWSKELEEYEEAKKKEEDNFNSNGEIIDFGICGSYYEGLVA